MWTNLYIFGMALNNQDSTCTFAQHSKKTSYSKVDRYINSGHLKYLRLLKCYSYILFFQVPDIHYTAEAHDNPGYMKHSEVQRDPVVAGLPTAGAEGGGVGAPLPDKKMMSVEYITSGPDPYAGIVGPAVGRLAPPDEHYEVGHLF